MLISTAAAVAVLIKVLAPATAQERLDAIRTGLAIGAGIGAMITLALALRRQQSTEHDATERRLTELYVKAVDQLGSDRAAVRNGGLYALERVAQDNAAHRQTIVDVICAYLRSPYSPPRATGASKLGGLRAPLRPGWARPLPTVAPDTTPKDSDHEAQQEREVRLTAQRILRNHLQPRRRARTWRRWFPRRAHTFWPGINVDLTGADLVDFDFVLTVVGNARFDGARFHGKAGFVGARFIGNAWFDEVRFHGNAAFSRARFGGSAWFKGAQFSGRTAFDTARFDGLACFDDAQFNETAWFATAQFNSDARFDGVKFNSAAELSEVEFRGVVPDELKPHLPVD